MRMFLIAVLGMVCSAPSVGKAPVSSGNAGVAPQAPEEAKPSVDELFDEFFNATGGRAAWASIKGMKRTYGWRIGEDTGDIVITSRPGGDYQLTMSMDGSTWREAQGAVGDQAWLEDATGVCHPAAAEVALELRIENDPTSLLHIASLSRAMACSGVREIAGRPQWRVVIAPNAGRPWYFFFDAETHLLTRFSFSRPDETGAPILVSRTFSDWKQAGPILFPHAHVDRSRIGDADFVLEHMEVAPQPADVFTLSDCAKRAFEPKATPVATVDQPAGDAHGTLIEKIGPTLVRPDGTSIPSAALADVPNVLLYFTAKWCGPCRRFTPQLVEFYREHGDQGAFEIVVVSSDRTKAVMEAYLKDYGMTFPSVPFERRDSSGIKSKWGGRGIPNLVWLGPDDAVVQGSYQGGRYVGPQSVLSAFKAHLGVDAAPAQP